MLTGLPPGEFPVSIFDVVLNGNTLRGSIVGMRRDLEEALEFAAEGKVKAVIELQSLESINDVCKRLKRGQVNGRIVLEISEKARKQIAQPRSHGSRKRPDNLERIGQTGSRRQTLFSAGVCRSRYAGQLCG